MSNTLTNQTKASTNMQHSTQNMYIGDPCYVIRDSDWQDFCNIYFQTQKNTQSSSFWMNFKNQMCYVMETAHGDGTYPLKNNRDITVSELFVDSGLIACIPKSIITDEIQNENYNTFFYDNINTKYIYSEDSTLYADDYLCNTNYNTDNNEYDNNYNDIYDNAYEYNDDDDDTNYDEY